MTLWLTVTAALASALMAGVFFAFSSFVMPALGRIQPAEAIRAMQQINIDVFHWSFVVAFFGTPTACVALAAMAIWHWHDPGALYRVAGAVVYLVGSLLVTAAGNVPRNNALAAVDADAADAAREWDRFALGWTRWNHVRTVASLAAAGAFVAAAVAA